MSLSRCRVVLVGTQFPGNVGAVARVMCNFGLDDLVLVAPACDHLERQARQLATHGEAILERCRVVADLEEALADCVLVAGTTARVGGLFRRQVLAAPQDVMPRVAEAVLAGTKAALVFGGETNGLSHEQLTLCHFLVRIPTSETCPSLNLAQAAGICLYELQRAFLSAAPAASAGNQAEWSEAAPFAEQHAMFARLEAALTRLHFLYGDKAASLMHALRHLLGRARLSGTEVQILDGLARQINWQMDRVQQ